MGILSKIKTRISRATFWQQWQRTEHELDQFVDLEDLLKEPESAREEMSRNLFKSNVYVTREKLRRLQEKDVFRFSNGRRLSNFAFNSEAAILDKAIGFTNVFWQLRAKRRDVISHVKTMAQYTLFACLGIAGFFFGPAPGLALVLFGLSALVAVPSAIQARKDYKDVKTLEGQLSIWIREINAEHEKSEQPIIATITDIRDTHAEIAQDIDPLFKILCEHESKLEEQNGPSSDNENTDVDAFITIRDKDLTQSQQTRLSYYLTPKRPDAVGKPMTSHFDQSMVKAQKEQNQASERVWPEGFEVGKPNSQAHKHSSM